jgi:hypothetical protein
MSQGVAGHRQGLHRGSCLHSMFDPNPKRRAAMHSIAHKLAAIAL